MSRLSRRVALSALFLGVTMALAAPPAQARESPPSCWLDALAHQVAQWTGIWLAWPVPGRAAGSPRHPAKSPPIKVDCGVQLDPNGGCQSASLPPH